MSPRPIRAARRPVAVYLTAVVGPTLAVLTLGILAAHRQVVALDALKLTTERLLESSLAIELERTLTARTAATLSDPVLEELAGAAGGDDAGALDRAQQRALALPLRYPFVRFAFVVIDGEVRYPRILPPWPADVATRTADESPAVRQAFAHAQALEASRRYLPASAQYSEVERLARNNSLRALAIASRASMLDYAGVRAEAIKGYRRLHDEFGETYSPAGRPYALVSALELARLGETTDPRPIGTRHDLVNGRWSLTADQAAYFLARLPVPATPESPSSFLGGASEARRLSALTLPRPDPAPGHVSFVGVGEGDRFLQVAYRADAANRIVGVAVSLSWVRARLVPEVARSVGADRGAELVPLVAGHPGFRTILPGWCIRLLPSGQGPSWLRLDFIAFAAIAVVVLSVLVMGVFVLMRDVQRETKLNQLRADLVSGVSHELKTPLSVIRVYAETIDEVPDVASADRKRFAAAIVQETDRLRRLVDGVIDFSRIQQGERAYVLGTGSIAPLVARTAERFREYLAVHDFTLRASIDIEVPDIEFDEIAVEQAVLNLLDNAFKYSGDSRELELFLGAEDDAVLVRIQDRGVGIAPSEHGRIFERFHRGDHPDRGGYGLGLYLVRHIMAAHGGRVDLVSAAGRGSTFTLVFPVAHGAARERPGRWSVTAHQTSEVSYVEGAARRG